MISFNPSPKPSHKRSAPKRGSSSQFSSKTIQQALKRDGGRCIRCGSNNLENVPHHIIYRSQMGKGTLDNAATICVECHRLAHSSREVRKWFEDYRIKYFLGGNE